MVKNVFMRNSYLLVTLSFLAVLFSGCIKGTGVGPCTNKTASSEAAAMQAYATSKGYSMSTTPEGLFYQVVNPGSGAIAMPTSNLSVTYTGRLISSDAIFDQQTSPNTPTDQWKLQNLIAGWQIGIPIIAKGGTIRLIIPSSLAYGCRGVGNLPGDAVLFFEITLVDFQ